MLNTMACVVEGCGSHTSRKHSSNGSITFHRFPRNEELKNVWIQQILRDEWTPKIHSHICSKHFTCESFAPNESRKYRRLKHDAIPTLNLPEGIEIKINETNIYDLDESPPKKLPSNLNALMPSITTATILTTNIHLELSESYKKIIELELELAAYKSKNRNLEKNIERLKKVCKRRLRKINTLIKRDTRMSNQVTKLQKIMKKSKLKNIPEDISDEY